MAGRNGRVTAADVAREAGVSPTTVSYVLNNVPHQKIPEETRKRVHAAVFKLGYKPSAAARALRRGRSDIVLLVIPDLPMGPSITQLVDLMTEDLEPHGLTLVIRSERHIPLYTLCQELMPAAVINLIHLDPRERARMSAAGIFVVNVGLGDQPDPTMTPTIPQKEIGRIQVEHLAGRGHRRIGYASPAEPKVQSFLNLRLAGVRAACASLGLPEPLVHDVPLDVPAATRAVVFWHTAVPRVTGVCAYNDDTAFALMSGARAVGLAVPADLAIIGMDNVPLAPFACPPLTTIDNDIPAHSANLASVIVAGVKGDPLPPLRPSSLTLVVRESA